MVWPGALGRPHRPNVIFTINYTNIVRHNILSSRLIGIIAFGTIIAAPQGLILAQESPLGAQPSQEPATANYSVENGLKDSIRILMKKAQTELAKDTQQVLIKAQEAAKDQSHQAALGLGRAIVNTIREKTGEYILKIKLFCQNIFENILDTARKTQIFKK